MSDDGERILLTFYGEAGAVAIARDRPARRDGRAAAGEAHPCCRRDWLHWTPKIGVGSPLPAVPLLASFGPLQPAKNLPATWRAIGLVSI